MRAIRSLESVVIAGLSGNGVGTDATFVELFGAPNVARSEGTWRTLRSRFANRDCRMSAIVIDRIQILLDNRRLQLIISDAIDSPRFSKRMEMQGRGDRVPMQIVETPPSKVHCPKHLAGRRLPLTLGRWRSGALTAVAV